MGQYEKSKDGFIAFNALDNGDCSYDQACLDSGGFAYDCLLKEDDCKQNEKFTCYEPWIGYFYIEAAEGFVDSNGNFSAIRLNMGDNWRSTLGNTSGATSVAAEAFFTEPIVGLKIWYDDDQITGMQLVGSDCVCHLLRYQFDGEDLGVWPES